MDDRKESHAGPSRRKTTCSNCRRRKSKCDNRQPQCSTCVAHNSECYYDKPPSLAYVRSLEAKIESLLREREAANSRSELVSASPQHTRPRDDASPQYEHVEASRASPREHDQWVSEISVDSNGGVCYHNPTSAIHEAPSDNPRPHSVCASSPETVSVMSDVATQHMDQTKQFLVSNAAAQRRFEAMAVENMVVVQNEISSEVASELLKLHWCWIHPMFMFVYRPAFTRDMALSNPDRSEPTYFSETLLKVIFAHSARFLVKSAQGGDPANRLMDTLTDQAHFSLAMRISKPSSVPTIQALLQQSAREVAFGNSSQAWLYSGMAFRIAIDLGIHLPSDRLQSYVNTLTAEDIEVRKRLFWSCYTWDKAISLYLGRMPAFTPPMEAGVPIFMDDFTENDPWEPYYGTGLQREMHAGNPYVPQRGHMVSCFTALCKLSTILSTVMLEIYGASPTRQSDQTLAQYGPRTETQRSKNGSFIKISSAIQKWWIELPNANRLTINKLPDQSPPLHIVSLNLLYHTTIILLHRPFILGTKEIHSSAAVSRSYQLCITAAAAIHDLLELLTKTFGFSHITYLNCYSTYIAATIAVLHFERQEERTTLPELEESNEKLDLKFFLGVLQTTAKAMPALTRSVEIVKRHMQVILDKRSKRYLNSLFPTTIEDDLAPEVSSPMLSTRDTHRQSQSSQFGSGSGQSSHTPEFIPPPVNNSLPTYAGFNLEGLPAFPGQNFNVGTDFTLDQEIMDPELRAALLGLDPHVTLNHENSDWAYNGFYTGDKME